MSDQVGGINPFISDFLTARRELINGGRKKPTTKEIMNAMRQSAPPAQNDKIPGLTVEPNPNNPIGTDPSRNDAERLLNKQKEIQNIIDSSPLTKDSIPTEEELLKAGYKKISDDGSYVHYEKAETGEKIALQPIKHARVYGTADCIYSKGDISISRQYSHVDGAAVTNGGLILQKGAVGDFTHIGTFEKNPKTGQFEVKLYEAEKKDELSTQQKEEFKNNSPLKDIKSSSDFDKLDLSKYEWNLMNYQGTGYYLNKETGERIDVERSFGPGGYKNLKIAYTKDGITHEITFDDNGQVKSEKVKKAGDLPVITVIDPGRAPNQEEMQGAADSMPLGKDKMPTEEEILNAGFIKNESRMTMNGGILYENPVTGESVILTEAHKTFDYYKDGVHITQFYGDDGKPTGGNITKKGAAGAFAVGKLEPNAETGKMEVAITETHEPTTWLPEQAEEAFEVYFDRMKEFAKGLGIPENLVLHPSSMLINQTTGAGFSSAISDDGNFKIQLEMDEKGNLSYTYSQKQADGSLKEIGNIKMVRTEVTSSLRGYDYSFFAQNLLTGAQGGVSSTCWS